MILSLKLTAHFGYGIYIMLEYIERYFYYNVVNRVNARIHGSADIHELHEGIDMDTQKSYVNIKNTITFDLLVINKIN